MSHRNDELIAGLFAQSERERRCLFTQGRSIQKALRRRIGRSVISPLPGLYTRKAHWNNLDKTKRHQEIVRALALKHPEWTFCSFSAACLLGLEVSWKHLDVVHVCSEVKPSAKPGMYIQRHAINPSTEHIIEDVRITPPVQTVVDCLIATSFTDAMPIADSALAKLGIEQSTLIDEIERKRRNRNNRSIATALTTVEHADAHAESGGESVARAVMIETGFAPDHLQLELVDPFDPGKIMRSDFAWEEMSTTLTLGEFDGLAKYTDSTLLEGRTATEKLVQERQRESHLSVYGHPIVRFTMREVRMPGALPNMLQIAGVRQSPLPSWLNDIDL